MWWWRFSMMCTILRHVCGNVLILTETGTVEKSLIKRLQMESGEQASLNVTKIEVTRDFEDKTFNQACQAMSQGVSLVADLTMTGWPSVQQQATAAGVPYVLVQSPLRHLVRAVAQVLRKLKKATDAAIILEDGKYIEEFLYHVIDLTTLRVKVMAGLTSQSAASLNDMRPPPSFYAIVASSTATKAIFHQAMQSKLVKRGERWLLFFTDFLSHSLNRSVPDVTYVTPRPELCCRLLQVPSPCDCPNSMDLLKEVSENTLNQAGQLLGKVLQRLPTSEKIKTVNCNSSQNATDGKDNKLNQFYEFLKEEVSLHPLLGWRQYPRARLFPKMSLNIEPSLGSWSSDEGLSLNKSHVIVPVKRFFRVGITESIPWISRVRDPATGAYLDNAWEGYCIDLLGRLAQELNFDYEIIANQRFGDRHPNGTWDGLIGDLAYGRTDIALSSLWMTADREQVVDFVAPYFEQSGFSIVIRKPERSTSLFKFMTVLRLEVWLSIVAALVVTGLLIWLLDKYSPYSARNNKEMHPYPCREFTLKESFWFAMTSFTPQGGGETPKALSGRTLVAAYWLFVVLMLATFTANLAAFLTVERMQSPVQSLEQLARQSRINYTVVKDDDAHNYFRNMKLAEDLLYNKWKEITLNASSYETQFRVWDYPVKEQYGHILQAIEKAGPVPDAATGFAKVYEQESGWFALIHDSTQIRYEVYRNCSLMEVGEPFADQPMAVAVQQGSQLNEEISRTILDLQKERYFESLNVKYWNTSQKANCYNSDDNEGITLESLGGVFIATLFGLALAMVTLALEVFLHKRKQKSRITSVPEIRGVYLEYLTKKELGSLHTQKKPSKLIQPSTRLISVYPRNQLF